MLSTRWVIAAGGAAGVGAGASPVVTAAVAAASRAGLRTTSAAIESSRRIAPAASYSTEAAQETAKANGSGDGKKHTAGRKMRKVMTPSRKIMKKFYKNVTVEPWDGTADDNYREGWVVKLDERYLHSPRQRLLVLPTVDMAAVVASEWESQADAILPYTMQVMSLAATATDRYPGVRETAQDEVMKYLATDTVCYRGEDGSKLRATQDEALAPVLEWFTGRLGALDVTAGFQTSHPQFTLLKAAAYVENLTDWELCAFDLLTLSTKSFVLPCALHHGVVSAQEALELSRLEESHQIEEWGEVEGGHDLDVADLGGRIAGASVFLRLLRP